jgi:hypothetical protein
MLRGVVPAQCLGEQFGKIAVSLVAEGEGVQDILALYPDLQAEDVREGPALRGRGGSRTDAAAAVWSMRFLVVDNALSPALAACFARRYQSETTLAHSASQ